MNYLTKAAVLLILCSITAFFLNREEQRGSFASANQTYIDWLIGNSKQKIQDPSVTYLRIDEETFKIFESEEERFGPVDFALLFDKLRNYQPKVTAVLPVLDFPEEDELLLSTLKNGALQMDTLLLGAILEKNPTGTPVSEGILELLGSIDSVKGDISRIPEFTSAKVLPELQLRITSQMAFTEIDLGDASSVGQNGLVVPLVARFKNTIVPSFLLQSVLLENDLSPADVVVELGKEVRLGDTIKIPIDQRGFMTVFTGLRERLPVHGADILLWNADSLADADIGAGLSDNEREALEKRVVLIGYNDEKAKRIPFKNGERLSHAELFSLAIATIQSGRYIHMVPTAAQWALIGGIFLTGLLLLRLYRKRAALGALALLVLFFITGMIQFQINQSWMPLTTPLGLIACVFLCCLILARGKKETTETEEA